MIFRKCIQMCGKARFNLSLCLKLLFNQNNKIMNYSETFFGKISMTMYSCGCCSGKMHWMHSYVKVQGGFVPMNRRNDDGSISVLGVEFLIVPNLSFGNKNKKSLQKSLKLHADKLKEDGCCYRQGKQKHSHCKNGQRNGSLHHFPT